MSDRKSAILIDTRSDYQQICPEYYSYILHLAEEQSKKIEEGFPLTSATFRLQRNKESAAGKLSRSLIGKSDNNNVRRRAKIREIMIQNDFKPTRFPLAISGE